MNSSTRFAPRVLLAIAVLISMLGVARADVVQLSDLGFGVPTVNVFDLSGTDVTASRVTILSDTTTGFLHFTLSGAPAGFSSGTTYTDLFDTSGKLVDRLAISVANGQTEVKFASNPSLIIVPLLADDTHALISTQFTQVNILYFTGIGDGNYHFLVQRTNVTPPPPVPEPASLFLFGTGLSALGFAVRKKLASHLPSRKPSVKD